MSKKPVKDVFGFYLLKNAQFSGIYEIPIVHGTVDIPDDLVLFSKSYKEIEPLKKSVHFYELDENFVNKIGDKESLDFEIQNLRHYQSVILPDFSVYRDMPLAMQIFQVYKSRAIGNYLFQNGIKIIPNVRWGDERTYKFAFAGVEKNSLISVGVLGGYRDNDSKYFFEKGFLEMVDTIEPSKILCYGNISDELKNICTKRDIFFKEYQTDISTRYDNLNKKECNQLNLFDL